MAITFREYSAIPEAQRTAKQFRELSAASRARVMFPQAFKWGAEGSVMWGTPAVALQAAMARRGEMIASSAAGVTGTATFPLLQASAAAGLALIPGLQPIAITLASMAIASVLDSSVEERVKRGVNRLSEFGRQYRRLEFGQGFTDNVTFQQSRMQAAADISGALIHSRRFLGQEARLMHR